jgi:Sigma-70 region 2
MEDQERLAQRFREHRSPLRAVAYRMLGSLPEVDDAVQEAWVRVSRAGIAEVENLGGWLTTIVARICLNTLRSRNIRRQDPLEGRLPDPSCARKGRSHRKSRPSWPTPSVWRSKIVLGTLWGRPYAVMGFRVAGGQIVEIDVVADPERVRRVAATVLTDG